MTYDLHPIFVHFPIALLFIYSIIRILPLQKWLPKISWKHVEIFLLIIGLFGAFMALATGDTAEHISKPNQQLVDAHSTFAGIATWIYVVLFLGEFASYIREKKCERLEKYQYVVKLITWCEKVFYNKTFSIILSIFGLIAITITGLLGGVIVHGLGADPLSGIVLKILGINL